MKMNWRDYAPELIPDEDEMDARRDAYLRAYTRALDYLASHPELVKREPYKELIQYLPEVEAEEPGLFELLDDAAFYGIPYPQNMPVLLYGRMIVLELGATPARQRDCVPPAQIHQVLRRNSNPVALIRKLFARKRAR